ncbi:MAG: hypothetical protein KatS3mg111_0252 [Pirellulaceae bacterium]|nr:MAG: hypothetical protein KatS3mg111_0252 [Pirellulaceae bacterium]
MPPYGNVPIRAMKKRTTVHRAPNLILQGIACLLPFTTHSYLKAGEEVGAADRQNELAVQVMEIARQQCVACHNAKQAEGGLRLDEHAGWLQGGDSGPAIDADQPDASYLLERVRSEEDPMPPDGNAVGARRLTAAEISVIVQWIAAGAPGWKSEMAATAPQFQPLPPGFNPIYAMEASSDNQALAVGHGDTVWITDPSGQGESNPLVDPALAPRRSTHLDVVQSIAFSPDSQRLATGGYRTLKIWRRQVEAVPVFQGLRPPAETMVVSGDGKWMATWDASGGVEFIDVARGIAHRLLRRLDEPVTAVAWEDGTQQWITCDRTGDWRFITPTELSVIPIATNERVSAIQVLGDAHGQLLAREASGRVAWGQLFAPPDSAPRIEWKWLKTVPSCVQVLSLDVVTAAGAAPSQPASANDAGTRIAWFLNEDGTLVQVDVHSDEVQREVPTGIPELRTAVIDAGGAVAILVPGEGHPIVWSIDNNEQLALLNRDYRMVQPIARRRQDVARQQAWLQSLAASMPQFEEAAQKEREAEMRFREERDKAAEALAAREQELMAAREAVEKADQALAAAEAAIEAAKQAAEQKRKELEEQKKQVTQAEERRKAAQTELAEREQALAAAVDAAAYAAQRVEEGKQRIAEEENTLKRFQTDLQQLQAQEMIVPQVRSMATLETGELAIANGDRYVHVFSVDGQPRGFLTATETIAHLFSGSDRSLMAITDGGALLRWTWPAPFVLEQSIGAANQQVWSDRVTALAFSPDGQLLAVGSGPPSRFGDLKILSTEDFSVVHDLGQVHSDTVFALQFSPDGRLLASAGADKLCRIIDTTQWRVLRNLEGHTHHVLALAWYDDSQRLLTGSADQTIKVWEVATGQQQRTIAGLPGEITALRLVGTSSQVIAAMSDGSVRLINSDDGKTVRTFAGGENALFAATLFADQKRIAAAGQTGKVWIWNMDDGKLSQTLNFPRIP